jgi:cupin 2 domain-containing protein
MQPVPNLLAELPAKSADEQFATLLMTTGLRIERIVSHGHASPEGFWYDQPQHEWVLLVSGAARVRFEDLDEAFDLVPGSFVDIPAHRRHRFDWTDPDRPTVWLAVHYVGAAEP